MAIVCNVWQYLKRILGGSFWLVCKVFSPEDCVPIAKGYCLRLPRGLNLQPAMSSLTGTVYSLSTCRPGEVWLEIRRLVETAWSLALVPNPIHLVTGFAAMLADPETLVLQICVWSSGLKV